MLKSARKSEISLEIRFSLFVECEHLHPVHSFRPTLILENIGPAGPRAYHGLLKYAWYGLIM